MALVQLESLQPVNHLVSESEESELQACLSRQPAWVQQEIQGLFDREKARSFQNLSNQYCFYREIMSELVAANQSEEAEALRELLREIPPSSVRALQDGADAIEREMSQLKDLIRNGNFAKVSDRCQRLAGKALRWKGKFVSVRKKLNRLGQRFEEEAKKFEAASKASKDLFIETEQRRDWWFWFLDFVGKGATLGSASLLGISVSYLGWFYYLYQAKAAALGSAKVTYAAAKKVLASKEAAVHAAAAEAAAAKATAATRAADVAAANHALQGATGGEAAAIVPSAHGGAKAVAVVAGGSAVVDAWLLHAADVAQVAYQAAASVATAASNVAGAAHTAMAGAAAEAASAASNIDTLQVAMASLSSTMLSAAPVAVAAGTMLALCMIGYAGRDLVKRILRRLWQYELKRHAEMSECFQARAQWLRDGLSKLRTLSENTEKLEDALVLVAEVAEELSGLAEDSDTVVLDEDVDMMEQQVDEMTKAFQKAGQAFAAFQDSLEDVSQVTFLAHDAAPKKLQKAPLCVENAPLCVENDAEGEDGSMTSSSEWEVVDGDAMVQAEAQQVMP